MAKKNGAKKKATKKASSSWRTKVDWVAAGKKANATRRRNLRIAADLEHEVAKSGAARKRTARKRKPLDVTITVPTPAGASQTQHVRKSNATPAPPPEPAAPVNGEPK